jgi:ParB/RepB/Spo0J family partition protein
MSLPVVKKDINLIKIDFDDQVYRYSDNRYPKDILFHSIKENGLLNPPLLVQSQKRSSSFKIVNGFRRLEAARKANFALIPALVVSRTTPVKELFHFSVTDNLATRNLNLFEKAVLLDKLLKAGLDFREVISQFLPLIGLPPARAKLDELLPLAKLPENVIDYVLEKNFPASKIFYLSNLPNQDYQLIGKFLDNLKPSANLFTKITSGLVFLARRDGLPLNKVFKKIGGSDLLDDERLTRRKKLELLAEKIYLLQYPIASRVNYQIKQLLEEARLPISINLIWDKNLEDKNLKLSLSLQSLNEFDELKKTLASDKFKKVLALIIEMINDANKNR